MFWLLYLCVQIHYENREKQKIDDPWKKEPMRSMTSDNSAVTVLISHMPLILSNIEPKAVAKLKKNRERYEIDLFLKQTETTRHWFVTEQIVP